MKRYVGYLYLAPAIILLGVFVLSIDLYDLFEFFDWNMVAPLRICWLCQLCKGAD